MKRLVLVLILCIAGCSAPKPIEVKKIEKPKIINPHSGSIIKALIALRAEQLGASHEVVNVIKCKPEHNYELRQLEQ